jgi:hypothetical protein
MFLCVYRYPYYRGEIALFLASAAWLKLAAAGAFLLHHGLLFVWLQSAHFNHLASKDNQPIVGADC